MEVERKSSIICKICKNNENKFKKRDPENELFFLLRDKAIVLLRKDKLSPTIWNTQEDGKMVQICSITVEWQENDTILILS